MISAFNNNGCLYQTSALVHDECKKLFLNTKGCFIPPFGSCISPKGLFGQVCEWSGTMKSRFWLWVLGYVKCLAATWGWKAVKVTAVLHSHFNSFRSNNFANKQWLFFLLGRWKILSWPYLHGKKQVVFTLSSGIGLRDWNLKSQRCKMCCEI